MGKDAMILDIDETIIMTACQCDMIVKKTFQVVFSVDGRELTPSSDGWHHKFHQVLLTTLVFHLQNHTLHYYQERLLNCSLDADVIGVYLIDKQ